MTAYYINSENCLRKLLISSVGGDVDSPSVPPSECCSYCFGGDIPCIDILRPLRGTRNKRQRPVRDFSEVMQQSLKQKLLEARAEMTVNTGFEMFGPNFLCPQSVINTICANVGTIETADDNNRI